MTLIIDTEWEQFKYFSDSKKLQKFYYEDTIDIVVFVIIEYGGDNFSEYLSSLISFISVE